MKTDGQILKEYLKQKGFSQKEYASTLEVSYSTLRNYLHDVHPIPKTVKKLIFLLTMGELDLRKNNKEGVFNG